MKRNILKIVAIAIIFLTIQSCTDESLAPAPDVNDPTIVGAVTLVTPNPDRLFFNALNPLATEFIEFDLDIDNFGVTDVESVDVELVFTDKDRIWDPLRLEFRDSIYASVNVGNITTFPTTFQMTGQQAADALGFGTVDSLQVGDRFQLTYPINTSDGRKLTVALNSDLCNEPAQPSFGGCGFAWAVSCVSAIPTGLYDAVSGGTSTDGCPPTNPIVGLNYVVTLTDLGGGSYSISDYSAGVYQDWYGACFGYTFETSATLVDICNSISFTVNDAFGCPNTGTGTYDPGTGVITYTWSNCFGDIGDVVLTPQ